MDRLSYADQDNKKYHDRLVDRFSRTTFDRTRGIQAVDVHGEVFPEEPITIMPDESAVPFHGVTEADVKSRILNSKLISTSQKMIWAIWHGLRQLTKTKYNPGTITLFAVRIPDDLCDDIYQVSACDLLAKMPGPIKQAPDLARSSSEHLYFRRIPVEYIESMRTFTLRVSQTTMIDDLELSLLGDFELDPIKLLQDRGTASSIWTRYLRVGLRSRS